MKQAHSQMSSRPQMSSQQRDYSGIFLLVILTGIVLVVLGLTMAAAHSLAHDPSWRTAFSKRRVVFAEELRRIYHDPRQINFAWSGTISSRLD